MRGGTEVVVSVALSRSAEILTFLMHVRREEREEIDQILHNLADLGHVATFNITDSVLRTRSELQQALRSRFGDVVVTACSKPGAWRAEVRPAFLMPVWAFDHVLDGQLASTGRFLGLDLELVALSTSSEEAGVTLPGQEGRWLIYARPLD